MRLPHQKENCGSVCNQVMIDPNAFHTFPASGIGAFNGFTNGTVDELVLT